MLKQIHQLARPGIQFNLVLSDALHNQDAVKFEWQQLNRWDLLDLSKDFAMLWDDCESKKGVVRGYREVCGYAMPCAYATVPAFVCFKLVFMVDFCTEPVCPAAVILTFVCHGASSKQSSLFT